MRVEVELWVCATCGSHYSASAAGDLTASSRSDVTGQVDRGTRDACPYCGTGVRRQKLTLHVVTVMEEFPTFVAGEGVKPQPRPSFDLTLRAVDGVELPRDRRLIY